MLCISAKAAPSLDTPVREQMNAAYPPLPCRSPSLLGFCIRQFLSLWGLVEVFLVQFASVRKHDVFLERLHLLHYLVPQLQAVEWDMPSLLSEL